MTRWLLLAGASLLVCFFAGALSAHPNGPAVSTVSSPPAAATEATPSPAARSRSAPIHHAPRFTPPPIPADDPGVAEILSHPDTPASAIEQRYQLVDGQVDKLFGPSFPQAKRAALKAAVKQWMVDHNNTVRDYYRGEISQAEFSLRIHQEMLTWSAQVQAALSPDEYRRYADLEPNADPYVQLVGAGVTPGSDVQPAGPPEAP